MCVLEVPFSYYRKHQDEFVAQYNGKILVIVGEELIGVYDKIDEAYDEAVKRFEPGTFLLQPCAPGD